MELAGKLVLYLVMACCAAGGIASVVKEGSGLAQAFHDGLRAIASIFLPVMGVMVSIPYLVVGVEAVFGSLFRAIGADPAIAAASFLPADAGGYALALEIAESTEVAMIALSVSVMLGATLMLNIPIGFSILDRKDRPYMALGILAGLPAVPIGILVSSIIAMVAHPAVRTVFSTTAASSYVLQLTIQTIAVNALPIAVFCGALVVLIKAFPNGMVKAFMAFGKIMLSMLTLVAVASILEYYTGVFSSVFGSWGFDPVMADEADSFRAIETLGSIAMMLTGAFPLVYLIRRFFGHWLERAGRKIGLSEAGSAGLVATMANSVAMFNLVKDMPPKSKVMAIAFTPCAGYALGDWMAFNVNMQPNMVVPILLGQIAGGLCGLLIARYLIVPKLPKFEQSFRDKGMI